MKKTTISIILLVIISAIAFRTYTDYRVRPDIKDNVKKYNEQLIEAVNDLNRTVTKDENSCDEITILTGRYHTMNTSRKEKDLLAALMSETVDYLQMVDAKKENKPDVFIKCLKSFQANSTQINNYFKK